VGRWFQWFWPVRPGSSSPVAMAVLLLLAGAAGDSALVSVLRGFAVNDEAARSRTVGYYEALLNVPASVSTSDAPRPPRGWVAFGGPDAGIVRELPSYLRWEMRPKLDTRWNGTVFRTNRHGYRGPEVDLEKPAGTYRVLVFGSSNTMGYGVHNEDVYTRHLEKWLNSYLGKKRRVEVVNLAVAGDSPTRRLARIQREAGRWNADWLICDASVLDGWLEDAHIQWALQNRVSIPYSFVAEAARRAGVNPSDSVEVFREKFHGQSEGMLSEIFAAWSAEARRLGLPFTVVILPRADEKAKSPRVVRLFRALARQNGLDHVDLSDAFDDLEVDEFRISDWDKHPNARGHQAIFEAMRDALLDRGGPPGLSLLTPHPATASR
jgi:lysophospholipase L1-like esterase